ncbi:hypothetical protein BX666DRAFT_1925479 [Dichotomocladium elegans]|nr:hypothetical protein BX666DRAFT_1925479 [Dichotomocladium elegans]
MEQNQTTKPAAPKGLLGMFGGALPKMPSLPVPSVPDPKTIGKNSKDQPSISQEIPAAGGGAWRKSSARKERRSASLASLAQRPGKVITVTRSSGAEAAVNDDDDDIQMGGMGKKKNSKRRFSPYNSRDRAARAKLKQAATESAPENRVDILISGFIPGSEENVLVFLQQKSKKTWTPLDFKVDQGQILLTVNGPVIANAVTRLNGYVFGTGPLNITQVSAPLPAQVSANAKPTTMDYIREFLRSRWNAEQHLLNLDSMAEDPILKKHAIRPPGHPKANDFSGPVMMKLAGDMFPTTVSISFARNTLKNVQPISTVAQFLPGIQNLSLEGNRISSFAGLDALAGQGKLKNLRELVLHGNPVYESERKRGNDRGYIKAIIKRFPSLEMIDGCPISLADPDVLSAKKRKLIPLDTKESFFDNEESKNAAIDFLTKYFHLFDKDRRGLGAVYNESSTFSVNAMLTLSNTKNKMRGRRKQHMMDDDQSVVSWPNLSRNLKQNGSKKPGKNLFIGTEQIITAMERLPVTDHDLSRPEDFLLDAYQQITPTATLLVVTLHGEFRAGDKETLHSFDRTLILHPTVPNPSNTAAGVSYVVVSDMLTVRDYCSIINRIGTD